MGCDIHGMIERKIGNEWVMIDKLGSDDAAEDRNYYRFGLLANVRSDGPAPKGLPEDVSKGTKFYSDCWDSDVHSHSWYPLKEAIEIMVKSSENLSEYQKQYPCDHFFGLSGENNDLSLYRFVFFFDN